MASDADLVDRARAGDRDAFSALVARYQRLVVGVAIAIARNRTLAEDLGQDTFVVAWRSLGSLDADACIGPWLAGIARNLANNHRRKHARREKHAWRLRGDVVDRETPADRIAATEQDQQVWLALDELPVAQRETLVLYYFEERSVEDVAAGLGVSRDVVKQRLHRAREAMRVKLTARFELAVESMRPGVAFAGAVIGAITLGAVTEAAAATTSVATRATGGHTMIAKLAIAATTLAAAGTVYVVRTGDAAAPSHRAAIHDRTAADHAASHAPPTARIASAAEHARLVDAIHDHRQHRLAAAQHPALPTAPAPAAGGTDNDYVRDATQAILPLLKDCVSGSDEHEGRIRIRCTIESEPDVGAIVSSSEIVESATTVVDAETRECIRQTMYAIEIDPAEVAGKMIFETELAFAASQEAADALPR